MVRLGWKGLSGTNRHLRRKKGLAHYFTQQLCHIVIRAKNVPSIYYSSLICHDKIYARKKVHQLIAAA
jgi:hypothetical protein